MKQTALALILSIVASTTLAANPPLRELAEVDDGLYHIAVANVVRKRCESIDARMFRALARIRELKQIAQKAGYSETEINAFVDSDTEKARMIARAEKMFAARGVDPDNPDDLCRYGREEIASQSAVGVLLKAK
jgi:hypothetical protein